MPKIIKLGEVTRKEYHGEIQWIVPSKLVKNSNEHLVYYKSANVVKDYNDDPYRGGGRSYTKQMVLESVDYVLKNIRYHFGREVLKDILTLILNEGKY